jgi:hypothetical protein
MLQWSEYQGRPRKESGARRGGGLIGFPWLPGNVLCDAASGRRRVRARRDGASARGAEVVHVEGEEIGANTAAQRDERKRPKRGVGVEPDVAEHGLQVRFRRVRIPGRGLEPLLHAPRA